MSNIDFIQKNKLIVFLLIVVVVLAIYYKSRAEHLKRNEFCQKEGYDGGKGNNINKCGGNNHCGTVTKCNKVCGTNNYIEKSYPSGNSNNRQSNTYFVCKNWK